MIEKSKISNRTETYDFTITLMVRPTLHTIQLTLELFSGKKSEEYYFYADSENFPLKDGTLVDNIQELYALFENKNQYKVNPKKKIVELWNDGKQ